MMETFVLLLIMWERILTFSMAYPKGKYHVDYQHPTAQCSLLLGASREQFQPRTRQQTPLHCTQNTKTLLQCDIVTLRYCQSDNH